VPLDQIRQMPGFPQLTEAGQIELLNWPDNVEALSPPRTRQKVLAPIARGQTTKRGVPIDEDYFARMIELESRLGMEIQERIGELLRQQWTSRCF
jgi:hypothetical protein